ncbi:MAG: diguanylate cyclase [Thermodesulfobacteriota bacterium]|nr:diguanylate cyclase [Thermodesulfobacteriota bacterium]
MYRKRIKEILTPNIISVPPTAKVHEATRVMRESHISCVVAVVGNNPVGIFTERNIVRHVAQGGRDLADCEIQEVMTSPVLTVNQNMYVYEAFNLARVNSVRHLVAVDDNNKMAGIVTQSNITKHLGREFLIKFRNVSHVMNKSLYTVPKDESMQKILPKMADKAISCVIIAEDERPLGILTERDMARMLTDRRDIEDLKIETIMSSPAHTVEANTPFDEAANLMKEKNIRRLIVVDEDEKITGLITLSDIIKGLETNYIETLSQIIREKDIDLQNALEKLAQKTHYLNNILSSSTDMGVVAVDTDFRIAYFNAQAENIMGYKAKEVIGRDVREIHRKENVDQFRFNRAVEIVRNNLAHNFTFEQKKDNHTRRIKARMSGTWSEDKKLEGFVLMLRDITARKKAEETIHYMACYDALTDLPNRMLFNQRLYMELARAERNRLKLALITIDLDRFKEINDNLGQNIGDLLLQSVAKRIRSRLRKSDTVARIRGDEFILILSELHDTDDAVNAADKITRAIEEPHILEGHTLQVSASLGISIYPIHGAEAETLIKVADKAMYKAKEQRLKNPRSNIFLYPV